MTLLFGSHIGAWLQWYSSDLQNRHFARSSRAAPEAKYLDKLVKSALSKDAVYAYDTLIGSNPILLVIFRKVAQIEERAAWDGEVEMAEFSFPTIPKSAGRTSRKVWANTNQVRMPKRNGNFARGSMA